uniref:DUF148 domain-containing protein n=1 Tax=Rhabditophanes sp. KR3021 TaxID=114890 RepID=A0AC35U4D1_9BILA
MFNILSIHLIIASTIAAQYYMPQYAVNPYGFQALRINRGSNFGGMPTYFNGAAANNNLHSITPNNNQISQSGFGQDLTMQSNDYAFIAQQNEISKNLQMAPQGSSINSPFQDNKQRLLQSSKAGLQNGANNQINNMISNPRIQNTQGMLSRQDNLNFNNQQMNNGNNEMNSNKPQMNNGMNFNSQQTNKGEMDFNNPQNVEMNSSNQNEELKNSQDVDMNEKLEIVFPKFLEGTDQEVVNEFLTIISLKNETFAAKQKKLDSLVATLDETRQTLYQQYKTEKDAQESSHRNKVHTTVAQMSENAQEQFAKISAILTNTQFPDNVRWNKVLQIYNGLSDKLKQEFEKKFEGFHNK